MVVVASWSSSCRCDHTRSMSVSFLEGVVVIAALALWRGWRLPDSRLAWRVGRGGARAAWLQPTSSATGYPVPDTLPHAPPLVQKKAAAAAVHTPPPQASAPRASENCTRDFLVAAHGC